MRKVSFIMYTLHQIVLARLIKEDEMGSACTAHGRHEQFVHNFSRKPCKQYISRET